MSGLAQGASQQADFFQSIPGYDVILDPDDEAKRRTFRVARSKLADFLAVLVASGVADMRVMREEPPNQQIVRH